MTQHFKNWMGLERRSKDTEEDRGHSAQKKKKKKVNRDAELGKAQSVDSITSVESLKKKKKKWRDLTPDHEGSSDQVIESTHQRLVSH